MQEMQVFSWQDYFYLYFIINKSKKWKKTQQLQKSHDSKGAKQLITLCFYIYKALQQYHKEERQKAVHIIHILIAYIFQKVKKEKG